MARSKTTFQPGNEAGKDTRFLPGVSGNPSGRSSSQQKLEVMLADFLAGKMKVKNNATGAEEEMKRLDFLVTKLFDHASTGKTPLQAIDMIFDRAFGKAKQKVELGGTDGGPIQVADARAELDALFNRAVTASGKGGGAPGAAKPKPKGRGGTAK